ncbi:DNA gyrase inhibitor YacG [Paludisphaera soli]|uniref:DNA gyrase inhibitor YacG n=1 Tax=Paludisphaera soli TaxID=2712865 RepID=UPI0013EC49AF|nr:DNA gyrase inhibitor YacG [Paludisphaera soli]
MIKGRCPTCSKAFEIDRIDDLPSFPFCSDRCRLVDLGRWIDEAHVIPGPPVELDEEDAEGPARRSEMNGRHQDD